MTSGARANERPAQLSTRRGRRQPGRHPGPRRNRLTDLPRNVACEVAIERAPRAKSTTAGYHDAHGPACNTLPLTLEFTAAHEGYRQLTAHLAEAAEAPTHAYIKVGHDAPAESEKFQGGSGGARAECQIGRGPPAGAASEQSAIPRPVVGEPTRPVDAVDNACRSPPSTAV